MSVVERTEKTEEVFATLEKLIKPGWYGRIAIVIQNGKIKKMISLQEPTHGATANTELDSILVSKPDRH